MTKISNKLILILGILAFLLGLLLASPAYARTGTVDSGVIFNPYIQPTQYNSPTNNNVSNNNGNNNNLFSFFNSVNTNPTNTNQNQSNTNSTNNSSFNNSTSSNSNTSNTNNTNISQTTAEKNSIYTDDANYNNTITSDINENYGSLASTTLLGSSTFMPSGLIQWIFFVIIILAIIFLWRYLYAEKKYMAEPVKHT